MALSGANLGGRVGWASLSDKVGRKAMFTLYTAGSVPLYFAIPSCVSSVVADPSVQPLAVFYGTCRTAKMAVSLVPSAVMWCGDWRYTVFYDMA